MHRFVIPRPSPPGLLTRYEAEAYTRKLRAMEEWCQGNLTHTWTSWYGKFEFADEKDYIAFLLRWS